MAKRRRSRSKAQLKTRSKSRAIIKTNNNKVKKRVQNIKKLNKQSIKKQGVTVFKTVKDMGRPVTINEIKKTLIERKPRFFKNNPNIKSTLKKILEMGINLGYFEKRDDRYAVRPTPSTSKQIALNHK